MKRDDAVDDDDDGSGKDDKVGGTFSLDGSKLSLMAGTYILFLETLECT